MLKLKRSVCQMLILCSLACVPLSAFAAGSVSVSQAGDTVFNLVANGLNGPAGYDITFSFDSTRFSNPRVALGSAASGAMLAANTALPGMVHIALVKHTAMVGTGTVVTLSFDRIGDGPSPITIVKGSVIDANSHNLSPRFVGWAPVTPQPTTDTATVTTDTPAPTAIVTPGPTQTVVTTGGSGTYVVGGTVTLPPDVFGARDRKEAPAQPQPVQQEIRDSAVPAPASPQSPAPSEAQAANRKAQSYTPRPVQSVLEKFRLFTGEKTPGNLAALFDPDTAAPFSQVPAICIADGKAGVKVTVSKVFSDKDPNFTFSHAGYLSLKQVGDGEWQVEVRPDKGVLRAGISMLIDNAQQEIPLTVAPQVDIDLGKSGRPTEADFQLFLKTRGTDGAPKFDLNGDGKRDYLDDYIFTANYLVAKAGKKETPAQKKAQ